MKKILVYCLCIGLVVGALSGCSGKLEAQESTVSLDKKGKVTELTVESFEKDYYSEEDLESFINQQLEEYKSGNADSHIEVKDISVKDQTAKVTIEYGDATEYASFNGIEFFAGTVVQAMAAGYKFDVDFYEAGEAGDTGADSGLSDDAGSGMSDGTGSGASDGAGSGTSDGADSGLSDTGDGSGSGASDDAVEGDASATEVITGMTGGSQSSEDAGSTSAETTSEESTSEETTSEGSASAGAASGEAGISSEDTGTASGEEGTAAKAAAGSGKAAVSASNIVNNTEYKVIITDGRLNVKVDGEILYSSDPAAVLVDSGTISFPDAQDQVEGMEKTAVYIIYR